MGSAAENFDAWFKERLESFEEPPKAEAWENIAERLGHKRKKRVLVFIMRIAAGMLLMMSLGLGYYYIIRQDRAMESPVTGAQKQPVQPPAGTLEPAGNTDNLSGTEHSNIPEAPAGKSGRADVQHYASGMTTTAGERLPAGDEIIAVVVAEGPGQDAELTGLSEMPARIDPIAAAVENDSRVPGLQLRQPVYPLPENEWIMKYNLADIEESGEEENSDKNWMVGGQLAPLYSYRNITSESLSSEDMKMLNNTEKGIVALAGGFVVAFSPSSRLSVQTGIYYSRYGQEKTDLESVAYNNVNFYSDGDPKNMAVESNIQYGIINSTGIITPNSNADMETASQRNNTMTQKDLRQWGVAYVIEEQPVESASGNVGVDASAFQYLEYLEVPLILKYKLIDRKLDFSLFGGISSNFLAGNKVVIDNREFTVNFGKTESIDKVNYSGSLGIGLEYPVMNNILFNLEPKFRYYINNIDNRADRNVYPYSVGVFAGFSFIF